VSDAVEREETGEVPPPRRPRHPVGTLRLALGGYVAVNALFGVPLLLAPVGSLRAIGVPPGVAAGLGGLRWVGAMLVAWGISGLLVLARPVGRAFFVTASALQMTFAAGAFLSSWGAGDGIGAVWFQTLGSVLLFGSALSLWWARLRVRGLLGPAGPE